METEGEVVPPSENPTGPSHLPHENSNAEDASSTAAQPSTPIRPMPKRRKREPEKQPDPGNAPPPSDDATESWTQEFDGFLQTEDLITPTPYDDAAISGDYLPPEAKACPLEHRRLVIAAHRDLGHPGSFTLVRILSLIHI